MAEDAQFKALLAQRISSYLEEEEELGRQIIEWTEQKASVTARRESAEALYAAEFGESFRPPTSEAEQLAIDPAKPTAMGPYSGMSWSEALAHVLREADAPLHVKQIWEALSAGGFRTDARDPLRSVVSIMVRRPEFLKVGANRYALAQTHREGAHGERGDA